MHRTSTANQKFPEKFSYPRRPASRPNLVLYPGILILKFATNDMSSRPERSEVEGSAFFWLTSERMLKVTATRLKLLS